MSRTRTLVVAAIAASALLGAGAVMGASAVTARGGAGSPSTSPDSLEALAYDGALGVLGDDPSAVGTGPGGMGDRMGPRHRFHGPMVDRFLHGEVVIKGKDDQPVTVALQRGAVTAVDGDSVTVKSEDGYERTWALTSDTTYRSFRDKGSKADVKVGVTVRLAGPVDGGNATARIVGIPPAGDAFRSGNPPAASPSGSAAATSTA